MRSGIGRDGVVMMSVGIPRRSVTAFSIGTAIEGDFGDAEDERVAGLLGLAEKNTRGRVRHMAIATDSAERCLKERVRDALTVEMGGVEPFKEAYNDRVGDEVNAKAVRVVPCHRVPIRSQPDPT